MGTYEHISPTVPMFDQVGSMQRPESLPIRGMGNDATESDLNRMMTVYRDMGLWYESKQGFQDTFDGGKQMERGNVIKFLRAKKTKWDRWISEYLGKVPNWFIIFAKDKLEYPRV